MIGNQWGPTQYCGAGLRLVRGGGGWKREGGGMEEGRGEGGRGKGGDGRGKGEGGRGEMEGSGRGGGVLNSQAVCDYDRQSMRAHTVL